MKNLRTRKTTEARICPKTITRRTVEKGFFRVRAHKRNGKPWSARMVNRVNCMEIPLFKSGYVFSGGREGLSILGQGKVVAGGNVDPLHGGFGFLECVVFFG